MPFALTVPPANDTDARSSAVNRESMPRISIGDCSLYYERHGMGFPILFVSGLGGFASFWQDQIAAFAKRFEVVTFDHRGIGQSDQARFGYTVERMAADEKNPELKAQLERQAAAYRKLAAERAKKLGLQPPPSGPKNAN